VHAQTYRWVDANGGINFTDNYNDIPAQYRKQAQIIEEPKSYNIMPGTDSAGDAKVKARKPAITAATMANNSTAAISPKRKSHGRLVKPRKHQQQLEIPTTPARQAQDRIEEQLRRDRQKLDESRQPARRALEKNEEQIRKTRDGISGH
ncbi:MAG: DUF4124 domain-containing protein, partial [Geobacter sp.]|nr:DUF4124 domain-containing protein [Geobacter sp.]